MKYNCAFCGTELRDVFVDLGSMPPSNSLLTKEQLDKPETHYPVKVYVCSVCSLVQLPEIKKANEIFNDDYVYYSSESPGNVRHAKELIDMLVDRFKYNSDSSVLEIGCNDGYMLQHVKSRDIYCMGVEPSQGCAISAHSKGINVMCNFFTERLSEDIGKFDLIMGINVLAHMPDINDVMKGLKNCLRKNGVIVFEFPHLFNLVKKVQFDTIYAEHFFYFSLTALTRIFSMHNLKIFDVEEIPEHGGSLRIFAEHHDGMRVVYDSVQRVMDAEKEINYKDFQVAVNNKRQDFLWELYRAWPETVAAYGAAAKASVFFNFCGVRAGMIKFIVDKSPHKIGKFLPGSHIPIVSEDIIHRFHPDHIIITAWNLEDEIRKQLDYIDSWNGEFISLK